VCEREGARERVSGEAHATNARAPLALYGAYHIYLYIHIYWHLAARGARHRPDRAGRLAVDGLGHGPVEHAAQPSEERPDLGFRVKV